MSVSFREVLHVLEQWAANELPIVDFTVSNILSALGKSDKSEYDDVFRHLFRMQGEEVVPKLIYLCPHNHKDVSVSLELEDVEPGKLKYSIGEPDDLENTVNCYVCGTEYELDIDNAIIAFDLTHSFREDCKKKIPDSEQVRVAATSTGVDPALRELHDHGLIDINKIEGKIIVNIDKRTYIDKSDRSFNNSGTINAPVQFNAGNVSGDLTQTQNVQMGTSEVDAYQKYLEKIKSSGLDEEQIKSSTDTLNSMKDLKEAGQMKPNLFKTLWSTIPKALKTIAEAKDAVKDLTDGLDIDLSDLF